MSNGQRHSLIWQGIYMCVGKKNSKYDFIIIHKIIIVSSFPTSIWMRPVCKGSGEVFMVLAAKDMREDQISSFYSVITGGGGG